jgi:hypothetical protein
VHVIDLIAKVVLITLAGGFMLSVIAGMVVIAYAVYRDAFVRGEDDSSFALGPNGRNALAMLWPWFRRLLFIWVCALVIGLTCVLIHVLVAHST